MRVLCIGDSLTAGFVDGGSRFFPYAQTLQKLLDKDCGKGKHQVEEASSCGETAVSMAKRRVVETEVDRRKRSPPKIVCILGGTNDLRAWPVLSVDEILSALATLVEAVTAAGAKPIVLTVPRIPSSEVRTATLADRRRALNAAIRSTYVHADVAADFEDDDASVFYDPDGLHLTKAGYAKLARVVLPALRAAMKKKTSIAKQRTPAAGDDGRPDPGPSGSPGATA